MRFEFYHEGLSGVPKLSVDGMVEGAVHLTHWRGNRTPEELLADTSTEIALNLVASPRRQELTQGIDLVTNNHFDTDGLLSVWAVLAGPRALDLRELLVPAAEAGDFSEYTGAQAVRASIVIQGSDTPVAHGVASPLGRHLAGAAALDERRAYELLLPEVERVLTRTDDYEPLWREAWAGVEAGLESFARGASRVSEDEESGLSLVQIARDLYGPSGFDPARHAAPFTAISHHARGRVLLVATPMRGGGCAYRIDYPYYSWAVTVERPRVERRDLTRLLARLNELEPSAEGRWAEDDSELTSAAKFLDAAGLPAASRLEPDAVAAELRAELAGR